MPVHVPVLPDECVLWLQPRPGGVVVDGTLGGGGHTRLLATAVSPGGRVIACDRDSAAVEAALEWRGDLPITPVHANFSDLPEVLEQLDIESVDGVLLDLGLSSDQLADDHRGFSYGSTGPLDLRFDVTRGEPAWRLLERLSAEHLADLIYAFGEERHSRRIARKIVERRSSSPVRTAAELAEVVRRATPPNYERRIHPATRTFQALRIAVNEELKWIDTALRRLPDLLAPGGRLAVISFHSLEDRRVKEAFRDDPRLNPIARRPIRPTQEEIDRNPRSRSAKLRVAERLAQNHSGTH